MSRATLPPYQLKGDTLRMLVEERRNGLQGPVRRIHFAPPAAEELTRGSSNMSALGNARVSVLFANGTFGIWELDARNDLKPVRPSHLESVTVQHDGRPQSGSLAVAALHINTCIPAAG